MSFLGDVYDYGKKAAGLASGYTVGKYALDNGKALLGIGDAGRPETADQGSAENPNAAYLNRQSNETSQRLLGQTATDRANVLGTQVGQNGVISSLRAGDQGFQNTIDNPNAPSVAGTMLAQQAGQVGRNALGNAAGVGGANAFAARRQAMNGIAEGNTGLAQNAALLRQHEVQQAQQNLLASKAQQAGIYGQQAATNANVLGTDTNAAYGYNNTASTGANRIDQQKIDAQNSENEGKAKLGTKAIDLLGSALI